MKYTIPTFWARIMTCKHREAIPSMFLNIAGIMWCPDCGAIRMLKHSGGNRWEYANKKGWLLPKGYDNVLKQIDRGRG